MGQQANGAVIDPPQSAPEDGAGPVAARGKRASRQGGPPPELPARLLRRILSLTTSVGPETSLDSFSKRLAMVACEMGDFAFSVLFSFDTADDAFYAETSHGLGPEEWQEVLAVQIGRTS